MVSVNTAAPSLICVERKEERLNFNRENSSLETHIREAAVCVIDHDVLMRTRLKELFESVGLKVLLFDSLRRFFKVTWALALVWCSTCDCQR
jgi:hypothetical protein